MSTSIAWHCSIADGVGESAAGSENRRGPITEIHDVFTDFSKALTLKLRTRRTERSSCQIHERSTAQIVVYVLWCLMIEQPGKIDPLQPEERVRTSGHPDVPGNGKVLWRIVLRNECPCGSPVAWIAKWRRANK